MNESLPVSEAGVIRIIRMGLSSGLIAARWWVATGTRTGWSLGSLRIGPAL